MEINEKNHIEVQKKLFQIFTYIKRICEENNLKYFAIGGTCLGAVRHKGFIPWDDDMDLAMPRRDYEKFIEIAPKLLPNPYKIFLENEGKHSANYFLKVFDANTTFVEKGFREYKDRCTGIFVDIMPLDGIPPNRIGRKLFFTRLKLYAKMDLNQKFEPNEKNIFPERGLIQKVIWRIVYTFTRLFPANYFTEKYLRLQKKYDIEKSNDLCYTWSYRASKVIFPKKCFDKAILFPFEDELISCPEGYDEFLTLLFGDYMMLPPVEQQSCVHEIELIDLYRPFSDYFL